MNNQYKFLSRLNNKDLIKYQRLTTKFSKLIKNYSIKSIIQITKVAIALNYFQFNSLQCNTSTDKIKFNLGPLSILSSFSILTFRLCTKKCLLA